MTPESNDPPVGTPAPLLVGSSAPSTPEKGQTPEAPPVTLAVPPARASSSGEAPPSSKRSGAGPASSRGPDSAPVSSRMRRHASAMAASGEEFEAPPPTARGATRERIISAAFRVLAERGSHATSIKEIAKAAGVAAGLVHYYFASKEALLLEVTRECARRYRDEMAAVPLPEDPIERTRTLLRWSKDRGIDMPDWYRLLVDLDALALRDEALSKEVSDLKREVRGHIGGLVAGVEKGLSAPLGHAHASYAAVIMSAVDGLVLQKLVDAEFDLEGGFAALESILVKGLEPRR